VGSLASPNQGWIWDFGLDIYRSAGLGALNPPGLPNRLCADAGRLFQPAICPNQQPIWATNGAYFFDFQ